MKYKNIKFKLIDTAGQITAVVFDGFKGQNLSDISKKLMQNDNQIEQVVFIEKNKIKTMGNELCINGKLAGTYIAKKMTGPLISLKFPLTILNGIDNNTIKFNGIGYIISNDIKLIKLNRMYL
jgi:hypothetical protein